MKISIYQQAKQELKSIATDAKKEYPNDKPAIRQIINDSLDSLCKSLRMSDYQRYLLSNYACKLHPKK